MREHHARVVIRIYGIFLWVLGLLLLEAAFGLLAVDLAEMAGLLGLSARVLSVLMVLGAAFLIILGFQLQLHRKWARIGAIGIWLFGFEPTVKGLFGA